MRTEPGSAEGLEDTRRQPRFVDEMVHDCRRVSRGAKAVFGRLAIAETRTR